MPTDPAPPRAARRPLDPALRRLILVVLVGSIMTTLDVTIVNVAIITLDHQFHAPLSTTQWVLTGYLLALATTIPITGWVIERFGTKTTWIVSVTLFMIGSLLSGAAWSITSLIAFRVLQGMGGGLLLPAGQAMLARAAGPHQMGRMSSVIAIPAMFSPVLGPILGGVVIGHLSWRWMFFINAPVCAIALLLAVRMLPADRERQRGRHLDLLGLVLLSPGLATLIYGLSRAGSPAGFRDPLLYAATGLGVTLLAAFGWHALRMAGPPLVDLRLFGNRSIRGAAATLFGYTATVLSIDLMLSLYLQGVRGQSPLRTGLLLAPWGLGAALTMVLSMWVVDGRSPRGRVLAGLIPVLAGSLVYTQIGVGTSILVLGSAMFVVGLGHGLVLPAITASIYQGLVRAAVPAASVGFNIIVRVAGSVGTAVLAVVLQLQIRAQLPSAGGSIADVAATGGPDALERLSVAFRHSFWWAFAIAVAALLPAIRLPRLVASAPAGSGESRVRSYDVDSEGRRAS